MKTNLMLESLTHPPLCCCSISWPQSWPQLPPFSLSSPTSVTSQKGQQWSSGFWGVFSLGWLVICEGGDVGIMNEWIKELKREVKVLTDQSSEAQSILTTVYTSLA